MDGIDIALIETDGHAHIKRLGFLSNSHEPDLRDRLRQYLNQSARTPETKAVERDFTLVHAPLIQQLINQLDLSNEDIDIIGFHGQTIHHDPDRKITLQLGDGALLADETGINVVYDMRQADVQAGGQGAPLLPIYHRALTMNADLKHPVAIINIGGVGNITWIRGDDMVAFDTGPGNAMIDDWIQTHTDQTYDKNGEIAAQGQVDEAALNEFLSLPYFLKKYPKSLDRNDFIAKNINGLSIYDGAATLTEMTVQSIALAVSQCPEKPTALYITGGGRYNGFMMKRLNDVTALPVHSIDSLGWDGDSMEAEGFAYMAVRSLLGEPYSFPTTTGCPTPTVGGVLAKSSKSKKAA